MDIVPSIQPFYILKLPFIPLNNIILNWYPSEILDFSFASKKCRFILKSMKFVDFDMGLSLRRDRYLIKFHHQSVQYFHFHIDNLKKRNKYMNGKVGLNDYLNFRSEICLKWAKVWMDYICDLFRAKLSFLYLNPEGTPLEMKTVAEWMNTLHSKFKLCDISGDHAISYYINAFFETANFPIRHLNFELRQRYPLWTISCFTSNSEEVMITTKNSKNPVNWINVDQLLTSNCVGIMIEACTLNETDLNRIIRGWIDGNIPRMEFFHAAVKPLNFELLLNGIEFEKKDQTLIRFFKTSLGTKEIEFRFEGGYDIRRNDGTVATLQQVNQFAGPRLMLRFMFCVWPKIERGLRYSTNFFLHESTENRRKN
ncbi:hypothetical protein CRE_30958 [Caenorhabditis remanei]|uniref:Sdz-33 F-box domain-containing protein n=1 Tax=Caenorhabditis remanei TaxID=31234 RepID=E3LTS7_CAERE|nr:hypothetical protein CRE_30958 [Caenorhabditis remanei]